ncbi:replication initiation protein (plasmid) [Priestia megaterium]
MARKIEKLADRIPELKNMETRNYPVVKSNYLIQKTRYDLNLAEQKIVLHLIQLIEPKDKEFKLYNFSIQEYCKICEMDYNNGKNYINIKRTLKSLSDKSFWIKREDGSEVLIRWIDKVTIDNKKGVIKIRLDEDLKPYLLQLKNFFTKYNYLYVMTMKSQYSIRLYEILKSYENMGGIIYEVRELRNLLGINDNVMPRWVDFKRFVIHQAIKEINNLTDISIRYETIKKGRSVFEIVFHVTTKTENSKILSQRLIERTLTKKKRNEDDDLPY